jgi:hypothetical protein
MAGETEMPAEPEQPVAFDVTSDDESFEPAEPEKRSAWKSRLHDVAGSVSAWSSDDIDRLRVE